MRVSIYARVSTLEQTTQAQLCDLREYAANRGWEDVQEFVDEGISGAKDSRPAWNQLWDEMQKGRVKILLVHALDRLGRSLPHLVKIIDYCVQHRISLVSFRENIDLSTSTGQMIAGIFSVMAQYERSIISERTAAGMRAAKARGSQIGKKRRFFDKKKATALRDLGWGQIRIARELGVGVGRVNLFCREEYVPPNLREGESLDENQ